MAQFKIAVGQSRARLLATIAILALLGICLVALSLYLWRFQESRNLTHISVTAVSQARSYARETETRYSQIYQALTRLASRGIPREEADADNWEEDAAFYIDTFEGLRSISLVDGTFSIRQFVPILDSETYLGQIASSIESAPTDMNQWVPIVHDGSFEGFVFAVLDIGSFISPVLREIDGAYMLQLSNEGAMIFESEEWDDPQPDSLVYETITLQDTTVLQLAFAPTATLLHSGTADARRTLAVALLLSFISVIAVYFARNYSAMASLNELRYRNLFEASLDAIFITNLRGEYQDANPSATRMVGYSLAELRNMAVSDLRSPGDTTSPDVLSRIRTGGGMQELSLRGKDGQAIPVELVISPIVEGRSQQRVLGIARDITERKRSQDELKERVKELTCLFSLNRAMQKEISVVELCQHVLESLVPALQFPESVAAMIELNGTRHTTDRYTEQLSHCLHTKIRIGETVVGVLRVCYTKEKAFILPEEQDLIDNIGAALGQWADRGQAQQALRQSEERFRGVFENAIDGILLADSRSNRLFLGNSAICKMLGYAPEEIPTLEVADIYPEGSFPHVMEQFEKQMRGEIVLASDIPVKRKDGSVFFADINSTRVVLGEKTYLLGMFRDISERKQEEEEKQRLEAHLRQSQKLESIGTLASGVAHEINNPLMGMINYADLIGERSEDDVVKEHSQVIMKEGDRIAKIVRNLLSFSRQDKEAHSPAEIKDIIDNSLSLVGSILRKDQITVELRIPDDLPSVKCRSQQIQQVVINLLTNAHDALNERYPEYDEKKIIRITAHLFENEKEDWIRTTVEDHGVGILDDVAKRIFDPFFTTKPRDEGTGLGLSVSFGIVREHHGELTVESVPGEYTRFHMDLRVNNGWSHKKGQEEDACLDVGR